MGEGSERGRLTPVALKWEDASPAVPGLVVTYNLEYSRRELSQRLQRDYILLSHIPSCCTVFDMRGCGAALGRGEAGARGGAASRMESTSRPGRIHVSEATHRLLAGYADLQWEPTGGMEVKGKGLMQTYFLAVPEPMGTAPVR
ncbi:Soluble guanylate cyclase gcy-36 [Tetrabaena socialis]|uniref:Soluble guanylate cyclase gcy-36 n=1 Tax=Tetrabaena socialis TaxID=47790 RepID=A0A2J7ZZN9_9CHLO|nr:Soluble guanylate cyclase gcy-36 [Tetrabaena socialis]|eukprot:PNH05747.1 Soluble guanylate cyclase gcy-36 [Tetrabaena socialis]